MKTSISPCVTVLTALALVFNVTLSYSQKLIAHYNSAKKENSRMEKTIFQKNFQQIFSNWRSAKNEPNESWQAPPNNR